MGRRRAIDRLSVRINILIVLTIFLPVALTSLYYKNKLDADLKKEITAKIAGQIEERAEKLTSELEFSAANTLSAVQHITVPLNAELEKAMELKSGVPPASFYKSRMYNHIVEDLKIELKINDNFLKYRVINSTGDEIIRIDRVGNDVVETSIDELQNKSGRFYFKHIMKNKNPQTHIMRPTLNREHGEISTPHSLIFRIGKKITLQNGETLGMIVLSVSAKMVFGSRLSEESSGFLVIDEEGTYLHHWDEKVLYGKDLGLSANLLTEEPELKANLEKQDSRIHWDVESKEYRVWRKLFYMPHAPSQYLVLLKRVKESQIISSWADTVKSAYITITVIAVLSLGLISLLINAGLRPLGTLVNSIRLFEIGDLTARADLATKTEIGEIGHAFDAMAEKLEENINRVTLLQEMAEEANCTRGVDEVLYTCLAKVCALTGWGIGHVYFPDASGVCIPSEIWHTYNRECYEAFIKITRETTFAPGVGLPGRVFESGKPSWIEDIHNDSNYLRKSVADRIGIKSGFAFPALEGDRVVAVLEFYSIETVEPQEATLDLIEHLGTILGRVSERKRSEREIAEAHREVTLKAKELALANDELTEYAYVVSHDLKAPLRAIGTYVKFLTKDLEGKLGEKQQMYVENLNEALADGAQMIDDLLLLSRIDNSSEADVTVHLGEFLRGLVSALDLPDNTIVETPEGEATLCGHPPLLRQIFQNLIGNAVKFNDSPVKIVKISAKGFDDSHIEISVSDNGIGIEPRFFDKIFKVFERLHSSDEYQGTGIGLGIVRKAVSKSDGSIRVESEAGKGTTFFLTLQGAL